MSQRGAAKKKKGMKKCASFFVLHPVETTRTGKRIVTKGNRDDRQRNIGFALFFLSFSFLIGWERSIKVGLEHRVHTWLNQQSLLFKDAFDSLYMYQNAPSLSLSQYLRARMDQYIRLKGINLITTILKVYIMCSLLLPRASIIINGAWFMRWIPRIKSTTIIISFMIASALKEVCNGPYLAKHSSIQYHKSLI